MKPRMQHCLKVLIVTILTIGLSRMITMIPLNVAYFASSNVAETNQFDIYSDLLHSSGVMPYENHVVVVTLPHNSGRYELAEALSMLAECNPAAISIDIHLEEPKDPYIDSLLLSAVAANKNVVFPCFIDRPQSDARFFIPTGTYGVTRGFVNLDNGGRDNASIRTFIPYYIDTENGDTIYSLALESVRKVYPDKIESLKRRGIAHEYINYMVDVPRIQYQEIPDLAHMIEGRIVILGVDTQTDVHRTPINQQIIGLMIHAYTASTVINEAYIDTPNPWSVDIVAFLVIALFTHFYLFFYGHFSRAGGFLVRTSTYILFFSLMIGSYLFFAEKMVYIDCGWFLIAIAFTPWAIDFYNLTMAIATRAKQYGKVLINLFSKIKNYKQS